MGSVRDDAAGLMCVVNREPTPAQIAAAMALGPQLFRFTETTIALIWRAMVDARAIGNAEHELRQAAGNGMLEGSPPRQGSGHQRAKLEVIQPGSGLDDDELRLECLRLALKGRDGWDAGQATQIAEQFRAYVQGRVLDNVFSALDRDVTRLRNCAIRLVDAIRLFRDGALAMGGEAGDWLTLAEQSARAAGYEDEDMRAQT